MIVQTLMLDAVAEIQRLKDENATLTAALEPFAKEAWRLPYQGKVNLRVPAEWLMNAVKALAGEGK